MPRVTEMYHGAGAEKKTGLQIKLNTIWMLSALVLLTVALAGCGSTLTPSLTPSPTPSPTPIQPEVIRASALVGYTIRSFTGESLGSVNDVVISPRTGKIDYVVLTSGGFLDLGDNAALIPWDIFAPDSLNGQLIFAGDPALLQKAPRHNVVQLSAIMGAPNWDLDLHTYWDSALVMRNAATLINTSLAVTTTAAISNATSIGLATTATPTPTDTPTATATETATPTDTPTATATPTDTPTLTVSAAITQTALGATIPVAATAMMLPTDTTTPTATNTPSPTETPTPKDTATPTLSATIVPTETSTETPTAMPTSTISLSNGEASAILSTSDTSVQGNLTPEAFQGFTVAVPSGILLSTLIKANVRNTHGADLGTIEDIVLDLHTGEVAYTVLSAGGVWGFGATWFAVPLHELQIEPLQSSLIIDVTPEMLQVVPGIDQTILPIAADPNWTADVHKLWEAQQKLLGGK